MWKKSFEGCPQLKVIDDGYGIPRRHIKHITERFYRADNPSVKKVSGTGLGLAIVKHVANFHEATLNINSSINCGAVFEVTFPSNRVV